MTVVSYKDLPALRKKHADKRIAYCSGTFDLTHAGHVLFFEDCKRHGDILVVGVGDDDTIRRYKGPKRPIMNQHIRLKMVSSLKPVDYVFLDSPSAMGEKNLFSPLKHIFATLKPDVYVTNDDVKTLAERAESAKEAGIRMVVLPRTCPPEFEAVSTTNIIKKLRTE